MVVEQTVQPEASSAPPAQGEWTYADYARLPDNGFRYEVIGGELFMTPAPRTIHQRVCLNLAASLHQFAQRGKSGEVFTAPIDLILPGLASPVQPDILYVSQEHMEIVKESYIQGMPDLVVEVLSPGSVLHDRRIKFNLYARAGVREYWIVDPDGCIVEVYVLRGQAYAMLGKYRSGEDARSELLADFTVAVYDVCPSRP